MVKCAQVCDMHKNAMETDFDTERVLGIRQGPSRGVAERKSPSAEDACCMFTFITDISKEVCCVTPTEEDAARWIQAVNVILRRFSQASELITELKRSEPIDAAALSAQQDHVESPSNV